VTRFFQNEPQQSIRTTPFFLGGTNGVGISGLAGSVTVRCKKANATAWGSSAGPTVYEVTGGEAGHYECEWALADWNTVGLFSYQFDAVASGARLVDDAFTIEPFPGLAYGAAQGGDATHIQLAASSSATDSFYAGGGRTCVVQVIAGTGQGAMGIAVGYVGSTQELQVADAWVGFTPDTTTVYMLLPTSQEIPSAVVTAAGLATATAVSAIPTNPLLTTDARLNNLNAPVANVPGLVWDVLTSAHTVSGSFGVAVETTLAGVATAISGIAAIPTNPLLTTDTRLNNLNAPIPGVPAAVWGLAVTGAMTSGTFGELVQVLAALLQMNVVIDGGAGQASVVYDSNGVPTASRWRYFASKSAALGAALGAPNGTSGEVYRFLQTASDAGGGLVGGYILVRDL
jgi:hypothetical protein